MNKQKEQLRKEFFTECVDQWLDMDNQTRSKINMTPHNVFEWFWRKLSIPPVEVTDEEIALEARLDANRSQFMSNFPHDYQTHEKAFTVGAKWMRDQLIRKEQP